MKEMFKKFRLPIIITAAVVMTALVILSCVMLVNNRNIHQKRDEIVNKLEATAGTYSENTVILNGTSKYEPNTSVIDLSGNLPRIFSSMPGARSTPVTRAEGVFSK